MFKILLIAMLSISSNISLANGGSTHPPPPTLAIEAPAFDQIYAELNLRDLLVIKNEEGTQMILTDEKLNEMTFTSVLDETIKTKIQRVSSFDEATPAEITLDPSNIVIFLKENIHKL